MGYSKQKKDNFHFKQSYFSESKINKDKLSQHVCVYYRRMCICTLEDSVLDAWEKLHSKNFTQQKLMETKIFITSHH